jgi:hypothetical protein
MKKLNESLSNELGTVTIPAPMNSTTFEMNPYYTMASEAMINASTFLNASAQDFFMNQWPAFQDKMDIFWYRFKSDPNNWIALYPLTLFFFALVIWNSNHGQREQERQYYKQTFVDLSDVADYMENNIMARKRRVLVVTPKKDPNDHPMIRRSQSTKMYIQFE